jgi:hypothetical protein
MVADSVCDSEFACRIQWEIVLWGKIGSCVLRTNMCDCQKNFFKNIYLWSLECTLQQGILRCRFRLKRWLQRTCDRDFACRIQWEIVLRGKIGSCVLRANMCD